MTFPVLIFWALIIVGMCVRGPLMLYVFFGSLPFGAFAAIPVQMTNGLTFTPSWIAAAFLFLKVLMEEPMPRVLSAALNVRKVGFLTYCAFYGIISALIFPRLFQGVVEIIPMRAGFGLLQRPVALAPTSANITQTAYFLLTVLTTVAAYLISQRPNGIRMGRQALLFGAFVTAVTGVLDMATDATGTGALLEPFRTATYALMTDSGMLNTRRVVGLTPEASAFASVCMSFLAPILLIRGSFQTRLTRDLVVPLLAATLVVFMILSTSSAGYVGLAALGMAAAGHWAYLAAQGRGEAVTTPFVFYLMVVAGFTILVFNPAILDYPMSLLDAVVLKKSESASYAERTLWNVISLRAFADTWGLGAGLGSVRSSSWPVAVVANIGLVGAVLIAAFLVHVLRSRPTVQSPHTVATVVGTKFALFPNLLMGALAGTAVNFGLMNSWLFGVIGALCWAPAIFRSMPSAASQGRVGLAGASQGRLEPPRRGGRKRVLPTAPPTGELRRPS